MLVGKLLTVCDKFTYLEAEILKENSEIHLNNCGGGCCS